MSGGGGEKIQAQAKKGAYERKGGKRKLRAGA